jgi:hypothetical protein
VGSPTLPPSAEACARAGRQPSAPVAGGEHLRASPFERRTAPVAIYLAGMDRVPRLTPEEHETEPRSVYDDQGVDRSLIRSALERSPTECLELLEAMLELVESGRRVDQSLR